MTILIVEDDRVIRDELAKLLLTNGYQVKQVTNFDNVISEVTDKRADLILLDVNLPCQNGFELCKLIRKVNRTPIIFVTSRSSEEDELKSILVGGNDFIRKPYHKLILLEKIKRVKNLIKTEDGPLITVRDVELNTHLSLLKYKDKETELTRNEFRIAYYFFNNPNRVIKKEELLEYLWNDKYYLDENILAVNVNRLRNKAKEIGIESFIKTIRKEGYQL